jgi:AraC-like DNA-binding protein
MVSSSPDRGAEGDRASEPAGHAATRKERPGDTCLDRRLLWSSTSLTVSDATWERYRHPDEWTRQTSLPAVVFIREGSYLRRVENREGVGDPGHVSLYNVGDVQRIHDLRGDRTRCTTITLPPETVEDLMRELRPRRNASPETPFPVLCADVDPPLHFLYRSLDVHLREAAPPDPLLVEEAVLILVAEVLSRSLGHVGPSDHRPRSGDSARDRIPEVVNRINDAFPESLTLGELARQTGCSPWHLSRVFAQEVGIPISRYVGRLRARRALAHVLDGAHDLTEVALDAGFSSHGHFSTAFRREFGLSPRDARAMATDDRLRRALRAVSL